MDDDAPLPEPLLTAFKAKRYGQCLEGLEKLAKQGSAPAAVALAHVFFYGGGTVDRDYVSARQWLELVLQDHKQLTYASHRLGVIYYHGLGVSQNHQAAYRFFRQAALQGDPKSLLMVAAMQREGDGVQKKQRSAKTILACCVRDRRLALWERGLALLWLITTRTARTVSRCPPDFP